MLGELGLVQIWKARRSASACSPIGDTGEIQDLRLVTASTSPPKDLSTTSATTLAFYLPREEHAPLLCW